ncbi:MAG TPA: CHASE4 domain-containing protein [Candidatus Sumerlaeota bacterium]|nr:CHASE4 domain-containing protein [Candidatus Sumerlaeota bacterium]
MTLNLRVGAWIVGIFLVLACLNYQVLTRALTPGFLELERQAAHADADRCESAIWNVMEHKATFANDWAAWTDTYEYTVGKKPSFVEDNLMDRAFQANDASFICLADSRKKVVWEKFWDLENSKEVPLPSGFSFPLLLDEISTSGTIDAKTFDRYSRSGMTMTPYGVMVFSSRPIVDNDYHTPSHGTFVAGRLLDETLVEAIRSQTRVKLQVWPIADEKSLLGGNKLGAEEWAVLRQMGVEDNLQPLSRNEDYLDETGPDHLYIYRVLTRADGIPLLLTRAEIPREIMAQGRESVWMAWFSLLVVGALVLVVLMQVLHRLVIKPIARLTHHVIAVGEHDDLSVMIVANRTDEIGALQREFNRMVLLLEKSRERMLRHTFEAGMAKIAGDVMHALRNALVPMTLGIERMTDLIRGLRLEQMRRAVEELQDPGSPEERKSDLLRFTALAVSDLKTKTDEMLKVEESFTQCFKRMERVLGEYDRFVYCEEVKERVNLAQMVQEALRLAGCQGDERLRIEVDSRFEEVPPLQVERVPLLHVLKALLQQARWAVETRTEPDLGKISVECDTSEPNRLVIRIRDNGPGFTREQIEGLFAMDAPRSKASAMSFNLHTCANLMRAMGGELSAESAGPGLGACFLLLVPNPSL